MPLATRQRVVWLAAALAVSAVAPRAGADALYSITDLGAFPSSLGYPPTGYTPQLGTNAAGQGYVLDTAGQDAYLFERSSVDHTGGGGLSPGMTSALDPLYLSDAEARTVNSYTVNSQGFTLGLAGQSGAYGGFNFLFTPGDAKPTSFDFPFHDVNSSNKFAGSFYEIYTDRGDGVRVYNTVIGYPYQFEWHAAVFTPTAPYGPRIDLNTLIPPGTGWDLTDALKIDDRGRVVGVGTLDGAAHAYLLTPGEGPTAVTVPEPTPLALIGLLAARLGLRRRRPRAQTSPRNPAQ